MIGFFGGTFDPVHSGHLHAARTAREALALERVNLVLSARPPLRQPPQCCIAHRLEMLRLALLDESALRVDDREVRRLPLVSYTIDTLAEIRAETSAKESVCWLLGMDQLRQLDAWSRWQELTDYAHLVVFKRPGVVMTGSAALNAFVARHVTQEVAELKQTPAGRLYMLEVDMQNVSAREVRARLACHADVGDLLPARVSAYITQHELYQPGTRTSKTAS